VEVAWADVTQPDTLDQALEGADVVFHVAGLVSITRGQRERLWQVNVEGTRNVVEARRRQHVRRLVYVSSVHALAEPRGSQLDETAGFRATGGDYSRSKAEASELVLEAARDGLDAVQVLPTGVVGPWDFRLSEMGQVIARAGQGRMPIAVGGGYDWVDVRDIADGLLRAAERGRSGEAYLLNGEWMSVAQVLTAVARAAGVSPPKVTVPLALLWPVAVGALALERLTGKRALVTPYALRQLSSKGRVDDSKARRELGYSPRPVATSLADAWVFLSTHPVSPLRRSVIVEPGRAGISSAPEATQR
jgi:dihydroflavonol-4-reductase